MKEHIWHCVDNKRPMTDVNAVWNDKKEDVGLAYFLTECCPPDCYDCIEEYCYTTCEEMFYHRLSMIADDRAMAIDDEDYDREPYQYNTYYVKLEPMKNEKGIAYYNEYRNPIKVYKYGGKIRCKYV